jgi:hypothetical protein
MDRVGEQEMTPAEYSKRCEEIINISAGDNSPEEIKKYLDELRAIIKNQL